MRRWLPVLGIGAALSWVEGCGGPEFLVGGADAGSDAARGAADAATVEAATVDAAAGDAAPGDGAPADGAQPEAAPSEAGMRDGPLGDGPTDAASSDGSPLDAPEEPPGHCGGGFACTPAAPAGWEGPVELYLGSDTPPPCGANFAGPAFDGHTGFNSQPASCGCSCQSPAGVQCSPVTLGFATTALCSTSLGGCGSVVLQPGVCTPIDMRSRCGSSMLSTTAGASAPSGGSCSPLATPAIPPIAWASAARSCVALAAPVQADCAGGLVCAPQSSSPFQGNLCIAQAGDVACPATGYVMKHLAFASVDDTRGCSACTCGSVS